MAISINHYISPEPDTQCMLEKICGKFVNERISERMNDWHLITVCTVVRAFSRGSFSNQSHKLWIPRTSCDPRETEGRPTVGPQGSRQRGPQPVPRAQGVQRTSPRTGLAKLAFVLSWTRLPQFVLHVLLFVLPWRTGVTNPYSRALWGFLFVSGSAPQV